ncbi:carboxylase [Luteitalea sp. TBR-22]|uniref:5-oxoprolinase subunit C family protein n=1 Tax=Luteitalea sp. TBR-22 TaxID=2802971 RepID=UPI001AF761FE|nr:biotin-dependent carboxyltransferase family protein [Luteitalea sp. TBR-22]BCS33877.1 carboxylase [Luteitalea sp. TBR-22]
MPDALQLTRAGLHTTLQDEGRWGLQHLGVPVGGALDLPALHRANALVGNAAGEAALEITLVGGTYRAVGPLQAAVTGAPFALTVDGRAVPMETRFGIADGGVLAFGARRAGARAYLAVRGGFDVPLVLGSRSAWPLLPRRGALADGSRLAVASRMIGAPRSDVAPSPAPSPVLRVLPGPDVEHASHAYAALCAGTYRVASSATRMACPLEGPPVALAMPQRSSSGTVTGAVQVLPSGAPVLLLAERQTTGGYPVVAVVITADLPHVAQRAPGDEVRFAPTTRAEAMRALLAMEPWRWT